MNSMSKSVLNHLELSPISASPRRSILTDSRYLPKDQFTAPELARFQAKYQKRSLHLPKIDEALRGREMDMASSYGQYDPLGALCITLDLRLLLAGVFPAAA